jgi:hypothetical protein
MKARNGAPPKLNTHDLRRCLSKKIKISGTAFYYMTQANITT